MPIARLTRTKDKVPETSTANQARPHSKFATRPFGGAVEQAHMFQRGISNRATPRLLEQSSPFLTSTGSRGHEEETADSTSLTAREVISGASWDFSKIAIFPPDHLDSELSTTAAVSGRAAAIQLKQATGLGRWVLAANPTQVENTRGLPNNLKAGIEHLSGVALDDVKVHYNSTKPARLQTIAFAQGKNIYLAPRQEKCLPHEAWHVVQQAQGRVQPTMQLQDGVPVNDDPGLEREADAMGTKALAEQGLLQGKSSPAQFEFAPGFAVVQRAGTKPNTPSADGKYLIKLSSRRERYTYEHREALGLTHVLPNYYPIDDVSLGWAKVNILGDLDESGRFTRRMVMGVQLDNGELVKLKKPIPEPHGDKQLLVIDLIGYEEPGLVKEKEPAEVGSSVLVTEEEEGEEESGLVKGKEADLLEEGRAESRKEANKLLIEEEPDLLEGGQAESRKDLPGKANKLFMDVKIGTYTKSGEQFELEGANIAQRLFKKIEHNLKDWNRESRILGYDIDKKNKEDFDKFSSKNAKNAMDLVKAMETILPKLQDIQKRMSDAPITFVGSSLLIAFNMDRPENSDVKLIDPDHPIVLDEVKQQPLELGFSRRFKEEPEEPPEQVMTAGRFKPTPTEKRVVGWLVGPYTVPVPGRTYKDYVEKWQSSFSTGMERFIGWFTFEMNDLKLPAKKELPASWQREAPGWQRY
jgi:hypothetical protein